MSPQVRTLQQLPTALFLPGPRGSAFRMLPASSCACFLCRPCCCSYGRLPGPLSSLPPSVVCCEVFALAVSSSGNAPSLDLYTDCFLVIVFNFFVPSVKKGGHILWHRILIFFIARITPWYFLAYYYIGLFTVLLPHQKERTLRREIFILFISVSPLPGT